MGWALFICKSLCPVSETNARQGCCSHRARDLLRAHEAAAGCGDGRYYVLRRSMMLVAASAQKRIGMCDSLRHRGRLLAFIAPGGNGGRPSPCSFCTAFRNASDNCLGVRVRGGGQSCTCMSPCAFTDLPNARWVAACTEFTDSCALCFCVSAAV